MSQQISAEEQVLGIVTNHWQAHIQPSCFQIISQRYKPE